MILGIDPGRAGGIVAIDSGIVLYQRPADGPEGYHRHAPKADPDPGAMMQALLEIRELGRVVGVVIEAPAFGGAGQAGRRMSAGVAGHIGMEAGIWRALLTAWGWPYEVLRPQDWRKRAGITVGKGGDPKAATIAHVGRLLPGLDLYPGRKRVPHDGLADAAGMALAWGRG